MVTLTMKALVFLVALITASFQSGVEGRGELGIITRGKEIMGLEVIVLPVGYHPCLTGQATVTVMIRAHNATGEVNIVANNRKGGIAFTLGTRVLLTCDVTGLSEDTEVLNYTWYHKCTDETCEIQEGDPYYRVVADTLLVDVTSENKVGRYYCHVTYRNMQGEPVTAKSFTTNIALAG